MRSTILPIHPTLIDPASGAPLRAIGLRKDNRPIWPALGAEDGGSEGDGGESGGSDGGDGGKKEPSKTFTQAELDRIVGDRVARERSKYVDYDELKAAKTELDQIKADNASELDKAVKKAKDEGISEATTRSNQRVVAAAARALAAKAKFHEPKDAPLLLDLSKIKVDDDGEADENAIQALIDDEVKRRPYLVAGDGDGKGGRGQRRDPGQGARTGEKTDSGVAAGRDAYAARKKRGTT